MISRTKINVIMSKTAVQVLSLLRNAIIARFISPDDFGVAALIVVFSTFFEMFGDFGIYKHIVQSELSDDHAFVHVLHLINLLRGFLIAAIIYIMAPVAASWMGMTEYVWAFRSMSIVSIASGFVNLDVYRRQRSYDFSGVIKIEIVTQLILLILAIPVGYWVRNYMAIVGLVILRYTLATILSHFYHRRSYGLSFHADYFDHTIQFGWPFFVDGILIFFLSQSDKIIIGMAPNLFMRAQYSLSDLGLYSIAAMITVVPITFLGQIFTTLCLPPLSNHKDDPAVFQFLYAKYLCAAIAVSVVMMLAVVFFGKDLLHVVYGVKYTDAFAYIPLFSLASAVRLIRAPAVVASIARGDTKTPMYGNVIRLLNIPLFLLTSYNGMSLWYFPLIVVYTELLALLVSVLRLRIISGVPLLFFCNSRFREWFNGIPELLISKLYRANEK